MHLCDCVQYLQMLDATLAEEPYLLPRDGDGRLLDTKDDDDLDGLNRELDLSSDLDDDEDEHEAELPKRERVGAGKRMVASRNELTYQLFEKELWPKMMKAMEPKTLNAALVYLVGIPWGVGPAAGI
jgi:hypothetical protein